MLLLGCKTAIEKIAAFLLVLSERLRSDVLCLPMTRLDISDHLGLTIEPFPAR
ncbi:helix-turn-helix domain-containing protein [Paracoccus rhizosphaerae]|uniref:Helix-turn-helix domain-containing protein n=1 Tax=Paracoccus rhizosphaerae TaxID=1133347 RepID=A0ABV6CJZ8_9RHOB|nr:helix-turn-helix domain-containing protein [Paracoccus rhizosphaerae]